MNCLFDPTNRHFDRSRVALSRGGAEKSPHFRLRPPRDFSRRTPSCRGQPTQLLDHSLPKACRQRISARSHRQSPKARYAADNSQWIISTSRTGYRTQYLVSRVQPSNRRSSVFHATIVSSTPGYIFLADQQQTNRHRRPVWLLSAHAYEQQKQVTSPPGPMASPASNITGGRPEWPCRPLLPLPDIESPISNSTGPLRPGA